MKDNAFSLDLAAYDSGWVCREEDGCWALENVVTCAHALRPDLQSINLYVPLAYRRGGSVGGWDAATAPIVLRNCVGGYSECSPEPLDDFGRECLAAGLVYVTAGARGKQTTDETGRFIGKSPIGLVDLKAAVRFLKHNADKLPGNPYRILSTGVSAGGAMSSLLGVTGNAPEYLPMLQEAGAALDVGDDVFAAQCYCPIIDLEHADAGYEWMFDGVTAYKGIGEGELDAFSQALSAELKKIYIEYFNSLALRHPQTGAPLTLNPDGRSGSGYDYLMQVVRQAAQAGGSAWIPQELDDLYQGYLTRLKPCPSFDSITYNNPETQEFGDETTNYRHFSPDVARALEALQAQFPEQYAQHHDAYALSRTDEALIRRRALIDPFRCIDAGHAAGWAPHFRVRVGTRDPHTSFTMAMILATKLCNAGHPDVDYAMVWDRDHCAADVPGGFVGWAQRIAR